MNRNLQTRKHVNVLCRRSMEDFTNKSITNALDLEETEDQEKVENQIDGFLSQKPLKEQYSYVHSGTTRA